MPGKKWRDLDLRGSPTGELSTCLKKCLPQPPKPELQTSRERLGPCSLKGRKDAAGPPWGRAPETRPRGTRASYSRRKPNGGRKRGNCRFLRRETLQPVWTAGAGSVRAAGGWTGRAGQGRPGRVSLAPSTDEAEQPQPVERVSGSSSQGLVERTRRPPASATGTDRQRDAGRSFRRVQRGGRGAARAPLLAPCAWSGMRVVKRAASHKVGESAGGPGGRRVCTAGSGWPAAVQAGVHRSTRNKETQTCAKANRQKHRKHSSKDQGTSHRAIPRSLGHFSSFPLSSDGHSLCFVQGFCCNQQEDGMECIYSFFFGTRNCVNQLFLQACSTRRCS